MNGGYTLVDFFDKSLSDTPVKIDGIAQRFITSKRKAFLFINVKIGVELMNDVFTTSYIDDNDDLRFKCYDGYIKVTDGDMVSFHKESGGGGEPYVLPKASASTLGGVKVGNNLSIDADGVLSADAGGYTLPKASANTLGGVKVGNNLSIDADGVLSADSGSYTLPKASANTLGGVKVGNNLSIDANGVLSADGGSYTLPTASVNTLGGIKVGTNLAIDGNGVLSASTGGQLNYSTTEQVVGSWIDSKPVYMKVFSVNEEISGSWYPVVDVASLNIDTLITNQILGTLDGTYGDFTDIEAAQIGISGDKHYIQAYKKTSFATIAKTVIIRYTKTTD